MRPLRLSLLLERLRRPRVYPKSLPALVREHLQCGPPLPGPSLLRRPEGGGYALIPWDRYMEEAERRLEEVARP